MSRIARAAGLPRLGWRSTQSTPRCRADARHPYVNLPLDHGDSSSALNRAFYIVSPSFTPKEKRLESDPIPHARLWR